MNVFQDLGLFWLAGIFFGAALVIMIVGWRLASSAAKLSEATGLGNAIGGALLLGATTSLPGILTSTLTAYRGYPELAFSNAVGGIAAQTCFLALADLFHRKVNLEHAAASISNMMQATLLIMLLSIPLVANAAPELAVFGVHPASIGMVAIYIYGLRMIRHSEGAATWRPVDTPETESEEEATEEAQGSLTRKITVFAIHAALVAVAGWVVAQTSMELADRSDLPESSIGGVFTAVATSLPELVTVIAAVRQGALALAVGNIIGGNSFDTLFIAAADVAYRDGNLYSAAGEKQEIILGVAILMHAVLLLGLLRREKQGIGNIGFESFFILLTYLCFTIYLFFPSLP